MVEFEIHAGTALQVLISVAAARKVGYLLGGKIRRGKSAAAYAYRIIAHAQVQLLQRRGVKRTLADPKEHATAAASCFHIDTRRIPRLECRYVFVLSHTLRCYSHETPSTIANGAREHPWVQFLGFHPGAGAVPAGTFSVPAFLKIADFSRSGRQTPAFQSMLSNSSTQDATDGSVILRQSTIERAACSPRRSFDAMDRSVSSWVQARSFLITGCAGAIFWTSRVMLLIMCVRLKKL